MNKYNAITEEQNEQIRDLYFNQGYGQQSTAKKVGVSRNYVRKIINKEPAEVWHKYWGGTTGTGRGHPLSDTTKQQIHDMYFNGAYGMRGIAHNLGISLSAVRSNIYQMKENKN
jgi:DNA-binding transcriptional regulator LsrR (DeoR family)